MYTSLSFSRAFAADIMTYVVTSLEIALAYPGEGFIMSFAAFLSIFAITQLPLAIMEGVVLTLVFKYIIGLRSDILADLGVFSKEQLQKATEAE
jgi:cobalt/nickel transport system permease protein